MVFTFLDGIYIAIRFSDCLDVVKFRIDCQNCLLTVTGTIDKKKFMQTGAWYLHFLTEYTMPLEFLTVRRREIQDRLSELSVNVQRDH